MLEASGILPVYAQRIVERLCENYGEHPPVSMAEELELTARTLRGEWNVPATPAPGAAKAHVFVGPTATGKTTFLSKWLARAVLLEGQAASVWRIDGRTSNTAQSLSVYGEILGVPVERFIPADGYREPSELLFIDLPGVSWNEAEAMADLKERIRSLGPVQIHLVLNLAYETPVLLAQARAFSILPIQDLVLTHLDEEPRWQKAWNLVLGTNFSLGFLGIGQNVPGEWFQATPDRILMRPLSKS
jgi:flagellar biosynthesis protein FlhF